MKNLLMQSLCQSGWPLRVRLGPIQPRQPRLVL